MALPVFGAAGTYREPSSNGTSAAIAVPSGVAAGHVVLVDLYIETSNAVTPPAGHGFLEIPTAPSTMPSGQVHRQFWKRATGADAGTYTFTWTGSCWYEGVAHRYTGVVASGTPYDTGAGAPTAAADPGNTEDTPPVSLTTQGADRLLVWSGTNFDGNAWTPPTGFTERVDVGDGCLTFATKDQAAAGATGAVTGNCNVTAKTTGRLLALLPTASPPTVAAGADTETQINTAFTRTATDAENGASITAREWRIQSGTGAGTVLATTAALSWTPTTAGARTLRYSATNSAGTTTDDVVVTVTAKPVVDAGADAVLEFGTTLARTATDAGNGFTITARSWTILSGPDAGTTLGSAAALSWQPAVAGIYVLRYTATSSQGSTSDDVTVHVAVRILRDQFDAAYLQVQAAFGADLAADPSSWSWQDITADVRQSAGAMVSVTVGRADEAAAAQPSRCMLLLDNRVGDYSLGGTSRWWPYVRRNTPVRVQVLLPTSDGGLFPGGYPGSPPTLGGDGGGSGEFVPIFQGFAVGWTPGWDLTGVDAVVALECSGTLRRLGQTATSVPSTYQTVIERDIAAGKVVAYWPMTESTLNAAVVDRFREHVSGRDRYGMWWVPQSEDTEGEHKPPVLAADASFGASEPLPTLNATELYADLPRYTNSGQVAVRCLIRFPDSGAVAGQEILWMELSGPSDNVAILYGTTPGSLRVIAQDGDNEDTEFALDVDGGAYVLQLELVQSGGTINYALVLVPVDQGPEPTATISTGNWSSSSIGRISQIWINSHPDDEDDGVDPPEIIGPGAQNWVVGHVAVYSEISEDYHLDELTGHDGEQAVARLQRLAGEAGVPVTIVDADDPSNPRPQDSDLMGPQFAGELLPLLDEAAAVDGGVLYDGRDFGLTYATRRYRYSRPADLTVDVAASQLLEPFAPVDDDQATVNRVAVTRDGGLVQVAEDVNGPLGTAAIGFYDQSATLDLYSDAGALAHAQWRVHLGTVGSSTYRYPTVAFDLAKSPELAARWLGTGVSGRIDVVNLLDARTQLPGDTQSLLLQGYTQRLNQHRWQVVCNTTPYEPWRVLVVAEDSADDGEHVGRADTAGAQLNSAVAVGATSISVATTSGPLWATEAAQFPMVLDVGGIPVTATACSGASSPQTFTVTGSTVTTAKPAGTPVRVWSPPALAL